MGAIILSFVAIISGWSVNDGYSAQKEQRISLASSTAGGIWYILGGGIADIVTKNVPWLTVTAEVTGGYDANVQLLGTEQVETGSVSADITYEAFRGIGRYAGKKYENLRGIGAGTFTFLQVFTRKDSNITKIQDFKGKRIIIGPPGSIMNKLSPLLLGAHNLEMNKDWKPVYVSWSQVAGALRDGTADAGLITSTLPVSAIMDIATTHEVRLLPLDEKVLDNLLKDRPYWTKTTIPAGIYKGQDNEIYPIFKVASALLTREDMTEETIYAFTKALYENTNKLAEIHPSGKEWTPQNAMLLKDILPFHPGAAKYFKEIGVLK